MAATSILSNLKGSKKGARKFVFGKLDPELHGKVRAILKAQNATWHDFVRASALSILSESQEKKAGPK